LGVRAIVSHSIAVWRATISTPNGPLQLARSVRLEELPDDGDDLVAEIMRRHPGLSSGVAEYLVR
jgi:hypothetical protein